MTQNLRKLLLFALCIVLIFTMCGCFPAENIVPGTSSTVPSSPLEHYTSADVNRFIMRGEYRDYVVDQYGKGTSDCRIDDNGNILLNGRLLVKAEDTDYYTLPQSVHFKSKDINHAIGKPFIPQVVFFPENTSCQEVEVVVQGSSYHIDEKGDLYFTTTGPIQCQIYSKIDNTIMDTCTVNVYPSEEYFTTEQYEIREKGTIYTSDFLGIKYDKYMEWLNLHVNDGYYLGTAYDGNDARRPNGDTPEGMTPGMNCTGFVWHVVYNTAVISEGKPNIVPGMTGWSSFYINNNLKRFDFPTKQSMLDSGILSKGDIIWIWDQAGELGKSETHHVGIYWGDGNSDIFWHSLDGKENGFPTDGNMISHIGSNALPSKFVVIDMFP